MGELSSALKSLILVLARATDYLALDIPYILVARHFHLHHSSCIPPQPRRTQSVDSTGGFQRLVDVAPPYRSGRPGSPFEPIPASSLSQLLRHNPSLPPPSPQQTASHSPRYTS